MLDVESEGEKVDVFCEVLDLAAPEVLQWAWVGSHWWFEKSEYGVWSEPPDAVE